MRRIATLAALAVPGLLCAGIAAPAATAADDCPNAAVREQQASTHLPNCLAYEMVSPVDTAGTAAERSLGDRRFVAPDGNAVLFGAVNGFAGAPASMGGTYRSVRTPDGWQTASLIPEYTLRKPSGVNDMATAVAATPDLTELVYESIYPFNAQDVGADRTGMTRSRDLYRRNADGTMTWLSPGVTLPDTSTTATFFLDASTDMSRVLMVSPRRMAADVPDESTLHLYLHVDGLPPQLVTRGIDGAPMNAYVASNTTNVSHVFLSDDGARVVFQSGTAGGDDPKLYLREHADDPARARTIDLNPGTGGRTCDDLGLQSMSGDGRTIVFRCRVALTDEPAPQGGFYRLDLDTNELELLPSEPVPADPEVFDTDEALVPEDQNGVQDVYARIDGQPRLISSGTHPKASLFASVSADKQTIFFTTMESLVPQDVDGDVQSLYAARVGGGFMAPEDVAECVRECQGPGTSVPVLPMVASVSFVGSGNVLDPQAIVAPPLGKLSTAKAKSVKGTSAAVSVKVPSGGRVRVFGSGLRAVSRAVTKAGSVRLTVKLSERARATLARKGRVAVQATVRFVPSSSKAQSQRVKLTFTRKAKAKQGASRTGAVRAVASGKGGR